MPYSCFVDFSNFLDFYDLSCFCTLTELFQNCRSFLYRQISTISRIVIRSDPFQA